MHEREIKWAAVITVVASALSVACGLLVIASGQRLAWTGLIVMGMGVTLAYWIAQGLTRDRHATATGLDMTNGRAVSRGSHSSYTYDADGNVIGLRNENGVAEVREIREGEARTTSFNYPAETPPG
jgi:hypothetical protein